LIKIVAWF